MMIDRSVFAVFTEEHIYFLSVEKNERSEYRLVVKEISKVEIKGINFTDAFNIGEFIILAGNNAWNVFYLNGNDVKFFKFSTPLMLQDLTFTNAMSTMNSFLVYNQQFLLKRPSIRISEGTNKQITLKTSKCTQILTLKRLTGK